MSGLRRATTNPNELANRNWWNVAYPGHPYAVSSNGTLETVPTITVDDLRAFQRRVLARDNLKIGIVGNIDAAAAGRIVDRIFGGLPAKADLVEVPQANPQALGRKIVVELDVPQSIVMVGGLLTSTAFTLLVLPVLLAALPVGRDSLDPSIEIR